jgi:DNA polymerase-3 subunit delta'
MYCWTNLVGQLQAVELLTSAVLQERLAPAYLLAGPEGVGRSLAARCFSAILIAPRVETKKISLREEKFQLLNHPDLLWIEPTYLDRGQLLTEAEAVASGLKRKAPPQIRIEQIREIVQFLSRPPLEASRFIVIIEEAQTMTESAANALLKTLEEPGKATLILLAPSKDSLLSTLVSRCQYIPFYRLSQENLKLVLEKQGYQEILDYPEILNLAQGSPGKAISSFAQMQQIPPDLLARVKTIPKSPLQALKLAKEIDSQLDSQAQLWLLDYLQNYYWNRKRDSLGYCLSADRQFVEKLEKARQCLLSYVQSRLVWEELWLFPH